MTTFTREDFEHAARAAGVQGVYAGPGELGQNHPAGGIVTYIVFARIFVWNPPDDDGDALRLARHLRMTIADEPSRGGWSVGAVVNGAFAWLAHDEDQRAAIFRAAIAIGKAMLAPDVRPKSLDDHVHVVNSAPDQQTTTLFHPNEMPDSHDPI